MRRVMLVLAPMAGVSDLPFREMCFRYGADLTVSEMVASQALVRGHVKTLRMLGSDASTGDDPRPFGPRAVQIAGSDPEVLAIVARRLEDQGVAIIDLNMGCPVKKIVKGFAGAALMRDERLAARIVTAVVGAVTVPVTVKMRLGWDEGQRNGVAIARLAEECGARWLAVHGRTRAQMYRGRADWSAIEEIVQAVKIPVIGNGDVCTPEDAVEKLAQSGVAGIMVGRGALGRPWMFRQLAARLAGRPAVPEPSWTERHQVAVAQFERMIAHYGPVIGNRMARKHLAWYVCGGVGSARFRDEINRSGAPEQTLALIDRYYQGQLSSPDRDPLPWSATGMTE